MTAIEPASTSTSQVTKTGQRLIIIAVSLASLIGAIDTSIVNISQPAIIQSLGVSVGLGSLVIISYMLTIAGLIMIMGKIGDKYGFKNLLVGGLVVFGIGSFLCGVSPNIYSLIASRVVQGIGASMFSAIGPAIITSYLPQSVRGRSLGYLISLSAIGFALGPGIGGFITQYMSWRWIFYFNLPIVAAALMLAWYFIPKSDAGEQNGSFDFSGPFTFVVSLILILSGISLLQVPETPDILIELFFATGVITGLVFYFHQRNHPDPLINPELPKNRNFVFGILAALIVTMLFAGVTYLMPLYLVNSRHLDQATAGLIMTIPALLSMIVAPVSGSIADRYGSILVSAIAIGLAAAGFLVFYTFNPVTLVVIIIAGMLVTRVSTAAFFGPNARLIMGHCPPNAVGNGSGVMMTVRHIGMVFGIAMFQNVFAVRMYLAGIPRNGTPLVPRLTPELSLLGYQAVYLVSFALCLIVVLVILWTKEPTSEGEDEIAPEWIAEMGSEI